MKAESVDDVTEDVFFDAVERRDTEDTLAPVYPVVGGQIPPGA